MLLSGSWPLQRLLQLLNDTQVKEKEFWKESPLEFQEKTNEIGPEDRNQVVRWIAQLTNQFHFHPETFFLASSILDRFITSIKAQPKYLRCIAISCFYLASKLSEEEDMVPHTDELIVESKCGCRVCDVLRMERIILEKLSWNLLSPTPLDYLHIFQVLTFNHYTDLTSSPSLPYLAGTMTNTLIHAMCHYQVTRFPNTAISLALISLNLESLTNDPGKWTLITGKIQSLAKVQTDDLMKCRDILWSLFPQKTFPHCTTMRDKLVQSPLVASKSSQHAETQMNHYGSSGAIKRKALSPESRFPAEEFSKKHHSNNMGENINAQAGMYDSDATLTASEGERSDGEEDVALDESIPRRQLTYAEIVKSGLASSDLGEEEEMEHQSSDRSGSSSPDTCLAEMSTDCRMQTTCIFGAPSMTPNHSQQRSIRT